MSKFISHATPKPSRLRFPKSSRLRETREYAQVRERGKSAQGRLLRLALLRRLEETPARIGIITSRRVGGAVVRNRVRRRLRELVRHSLSGIPAGTWIVIVAKSAAATATLEDLRGEWLLLARRLSILPPLP